jgi:hypothetical protein
MAIPRCNPELVSTKISRTTKDQLQFIKSQYRALGLDQAKGDYYALAPLVQVEFDRLVALLTQQA